jgi:hypothetical protein
MRKVGEGIVEQSPFLREGEAAAKVQNTAPKRLVQEYYGGITP